MATVSEHKTFDRHDRWFTFTADQRQKMIDDDIRAGMSVAMVLISVLALGTIVGMLTVLLIP